jgi:hypothetical protein
MATQDWLFPSLGFVAGLNPYLGSGIRTSLSVREALQRGRREDQRREEEALERQRLEAKRRADAEELTGLLGEDTSTDAQLLRIMARHDPYKSTKAFQEYFEERDQEEPEFMSPEEISAYSSGLPKGQFPVPTQYGTGQVYAAGPQSVQEALKDFKETKVPGIWARTKGDEMQYIEDPAYQNSYIEWQERLHQIKNPATPAADSDDVLEARVNKKRLESQLDQNRAKQRNLAIVISKGGGDPESAALSIKLQNEASILQDQLRLAQRKLDRLYLQQEGQATIANPAILDPTSVPPGAPGSGQTVPSHAPTGAGGGGNDLYYDAQGNRIQ